MRLRPARPGPGAHARIGPPKLRVWTYEECAHDRWEGVNEPGCAFSQLALNITAQPRAVADDGGEQGLDILGC